MTQEKRKCKVCGTTESENWIVRENIAGEKACFHSPACYAEYKKKSKASGVCEFC